MTVTIYCEREDGEHEVFCEFKVWPGCKGKRDGRCGVQLEPDEDASLELLNAFADGRTFELTDAETDRAEELAWDKLADDAGDYPDNDR